MRKVLFILLFFPLIVQAQIQNVFSFQGDNIQIRPEFIDSIPILDRNDLTPYIPQKTVEVIMKDWTSYSVELLRYNGWVGETGDMDVIRIKNTSGLLLELKSDYESWWTEQFKRFSVDGYFLEIPLQEQVTALLFLGYPYASDPQRVTVILLHHNQATLVFNKHYYIRGLVSTRGNFSIGLEEGINVGGKLTYNTYSLFSEGGVLKFKQVQKDSQILDKQKPGSDLDIIVP